MTASCNSLIGCGPDVDFAILGAHLLSFLADWRLMGPALYIASQNVPNLLQWIEIWSRDGPRDARGNVLLRKLYRCGVALASGIGRYNNNNN